ncbi:hypothetical protein [Nocardia sp. NPDC048505]|uniref:hypothetical protein n=1 Tax=unclassified Nocardia TaxID=2637762 RepID=UPI00340DD5D6
MNGILPWNWWLDGAALHIRLDEAQIRATEDPALRRVMLLGNGAALHHLSTALTAFGWASDITRLPDPVDPNYLAILHLTPYTATRDEFSLAGAIFHRKSQHHHRFRRWEMPPNLIRSIRGSTNGTRAAARHVPDTLRRDLAGAYRAAAETRNEYGEFLAGVGDRVDQRDPGGEPPAPPLEPTFADPFPDRRPDAAELLVLCTPGDDRAAHLSAGIAASSILLTATRNGLAGALLTQTMKVPEVRSGVRDSVLYDCAYPHALIRVGRPVNSEAGRGYVRAFPGLDAAI